VELAEVMACRAADVPAGGMRIVRVEGVEIGIYRHDGQLYAYRNHCLHQGGPACEGIRLWGVLDIIDDQRLYQGQTFDQSDPHIVCPWHGYEYHLTTGECVGRNNLKLRRYDVTERDGEIFVNVGR
jgi:nitrite reductase/ring-hydroxylating ferredoxin subunit